jgi:outer membrane protein TolC
MKWMLPLGTTVSTDIGDYQAGWQPSHSSSTSWGVSITQPLLKGFGREVTMNPLYQAEDEVTTSRYQLEDEISQLILQVINDYYAVLQATQSLAINQEMLTEDQPSCVIFGGAHSARFCGTK